MARNIMAVRLDSTSLEWLRSLTSHTTTLSQAVREVIARAHRDAARKAARKAAKKEAS